MEYDKNSEKTTLQRVSYRNIDRINTIGKRGETFNDVLNYVLDFYEEHHQTK